MVGEKKEETDVLMWLSALILCWYQMMCAAEQAQEALTALPTTPDLELPTNVRLTSRCVNTEVRIRNNVVREDTKTFLIFLRTTSSTIGVDENRGQFTLHVTDDDYDRTAVSCPTPAVFYGHEVNCSNSYGGGSVCNYECNYGFERLSGDTSRKCKTDFSWSGFPLFCISTSCVNDMGIISCTCPTGYTQGGFTQDGSTCTDATGLSDLEAKCSLFNALITIDIDECRSNNGNCPSTAYCYNYEGSFTCICPTGYNYDGATCADINECHSNNGNCPSTAYCYNNEGSFTCICPTGYNYNGATCTDINECHSNNDNCPSTAYCYNNEGSFTCICPTGYNYNGATCADINECHSNNGNCPSTAYCYNNEGSFTCVCPTGYYYDGAKCADNNECSNRYRCASQATCQNTPGSYTCTCNSGYSGNGRWCTDINECRLNLDNCSPDASCFNNVGSFSCRCRTGYSGDGVTCEDNIPPTISGCPQHPIVVYIRAGQTQGEASWTEPTAFDVSGNAAVSQSHSPGDSFSVGSTQVTYEFGDRFNNMEECQFWVRVYTVDITCPSPITISYRGELSYTSPQCTINYGQTSGTSPSSCNPQNGRRVRQDVRGDCSCYIIAPHISCNFQITVQTRVQCPALKTISPGEMLSYDIPSCVSSQGSHLASCLPSPGSSVTTDTSVTCSCPQDDGIQCSFEIVVDCIALEDTICGNSGVTCDCRDESCDPDTSICSSSCTIVNTCPASIESVSLSQVNPSSSVNITCTLRGSRAILQGLQLRLSRESHALRQAGITELKGSEANTDKVQSTFRVENVTKENTLYCVLFQKFTDERRVLIGRVSVTDFVHELPNLNAAPINEGVSNTTITISWRAWDPSMDDGDPPIAAYIPYYRIDASDEWISGPRILTNETLQFKADSLEVDTPYEFSVAVVREGENGEGPRSQPVAVKTLCNVPGVAASVDVQLTSSNKVNVSWQVPPGEMMCSTGVTSYKVYYKTEGSTDDTPQLALTVEDVDRRWFIVDDGLLEPGSSYIFYVTVHTDQESGFSESQAIEAPVILDTAPEAPESPAGTIVAVICVIVLLIILLLVILVIIKRKRDKKADASTPAPKYVDNTYDNPVFGNPVERRQGAEAASTAKPVFQMRLPERGDHEKISLESFSVDGESSPDEAIYGNLEPPRPIRVSEFKDYFKQNIDKFEQEFSILTGNKKQFDWTVAENPANKKKNRFKNIYTYDHSRVVLKTVSDQEGSDYYNASFIKNADGVIAYIASQAPNKASLEDFIRMIWEQNVTTIVMVANIYEDGKERCHQYWPETEGSHKSFGSVTVTWLKTTKCSDFVVRYFSFKKGKKTYEVQQLHFLTWPDKDTPEYGTALIEFAKQSKQLHRGKKYPMLVHCSAGIGRTGTFICLSCMMDALRDKDYIDVFGFVNKMRQNRVNMVQTSKQYVFLYKCLNEYHLTHQTEMSMRQMTQLNVESHRGILLGEFESLSELVHNPQKDTDENCAGKKRENIVRNRVRNMVPSNRNRVFLMSPGQSNDGNYINASYVKSFQKKDAFILTQSPLPYTTEDFWRMVYDVKSPLVVMLNQLDPTDTTCLQYWPDHGSREYGNMHITCMSTDEEPSSYIQRTFDVKHVNSKEVLSVTHMQMKEWHPDTDLEGIVSLFKDVDMTHKRGQYTQPIVIHCINGFDRSGVMVTIKSELERIAVTERIDVFSTVKKLRDQHEHMLKNKDDYILCYHLLKACLTSSNNSDYENLEDVRRK